MTAPGRDIFGPLIGAADVRKTAETLGRAQAEALTRCPDGGPCPDCGPAWEDAQTLDWCRTCWDEGTVETCDGYGPEARPRTIPCPDCAQAAGIIRKVGHTTTRVGHRNGGGLAVWEGGAV